MCWRVSLTSLSIFVNVVLIVIVSLYSRSIVYWCCVRNCAEASMSGHCSGTWPVKTSLHVPNCNNKLLQMADIHDTTYAQRWRRGCLTCWWCCCCCCCAEEMYVSYTEAQFKVRNHSSPTNICGMSQLSSSFLFLHSPSSYIPMNCSHHVRLHVFQLTFISLQIKFHIS